MRCAVAPLLVMSRVIDAPRDEVYAEWATTERLARWWELRRDRRLRPDVERFVVGICELRSPERIVFTWGGRAADTTTLVTITLTAEGARTRFRLEQWIARSPWASALDRLSTVLHQGVAT